MAIINIESLAPENEEKIPEMLKTLNKKIAENLGWSGKGLRIYFTEIKKGHYCFGGEMGKYPEKEKFHPVVHLYVKKDRDKKTVDTIVKTIADVLGSEFDISPENVMVLVERFDKNTMYIHGKYI